MENMITEEEMWMIYDYITLSVVSDVIDHEVKKVDEVNFKFPTIIKGMYRQRQDLIFKDIFNLKVLLTGRGIKIYKKKKIADGVEYKFSCRAQEHTLYYLSETLKIQASMKMCELLDVDQSKCEVAIWQKN
ncbi:hypothetical protein EHS13_13890 [Paenibacillus psychroresistens]|uniref:Uncharacterized protein n=1 Tax=Paenibacillus psychroresistens TaxID=1778678 RepID=A0A6B8RIJ7_9BACL|nr:hypothetical protein [Paenibacillus psychroresistens]QGQ95889.1 hypothetical protein EHS13_13890 [Paenibacillus psychroresistens]